MADGRAVFDINGMGPTFAIPCQIGSTITWSQTANAGSVAAGLAVSITADGTADLCADAAAVDGKLLLVEWDGWASVQVLGGVKLPMGTGTATAGRKIVGALGPASARGFIRDFAAATLAEVAVAKHKIWSAADTANVQVLLT